LGLKSKADGSLKILLATKPNAAAPESNWLPAPKGPFKMLLRIHWPKAEALDGTWKAPLAQRVP